MLLGSSERSSQRTGKNEREKDVWFGQNMFYVYFSSSKCLSSIALSVSPLPNVGTLPLAATLQYPEVSTDTHTDSILYVQIQSRHSSIIFYLFGFCCRVFLKAEPVRPIDPAAWISHTTALTGSYPQNGTVLV